MRRTRVLLLIMFVCFLAFAAAPNVRRSAAQTNPAGAGKPGGPHGETAQGRQPDLKPPEKAEGPEGAGTVTRVYDIRDLIVNIPDFTDAPRLTTDGRKILLEAPLPSGPVETGKTRDQLIDELSKVIVSSVAPDTWKETGGAVGSIQEMSGHLFITHTAENQEKIRELLSQFRSGGTVAVRIRAHWVLTRRADLDGLLKPVGRAEKGQGPGVFGARKGAPSGAILEADPAALDKLRGAVHYRAETLCSNGQRVYVEASRSRPAITEVVPAVEEGAARSEPAWEQWTSSLVLDVQNAVSDAADGAMLTVRSQWVEAVPADPPEQVRRTVTTHSTTAPGAAAVVAEATGQVEQVQVAQNQIKTTARVPLGKTILIGGMTVGASAPADDGTAKADKAAATAGSEPPQLYLFIEVTAD